MDQWKSLSARAQATLRRLGGAAAPSDAVQRIKAKGDSKTMDGAGPYPYASLTAGLLARKGEAAPAMESFEVSRAHLPEDEAPAPNRPQTNETPSRRAAPKRLVRRAAPDTSAAADKAEAKKDEACDPNCAVKQPAKALKRRAAVTFRLTTQDFMRLKLASAELGVTSQDILTSALEKFLDEKGVESLNDCACLRRAAEKAEKAAASS